ncbi:MAG: DNA-processing protein DprA [Sulfuricurvum sp.]|uniref:DNA-processing protein DprA n=1 Tax=Sulfuricurvum sp. TaxID=2025608 RepID=UPI0035692641
MNSIDFAISELEAMKKKPDFLFYKGNTDLLYRRKVSIIGSRKPYQYTQQMTHAIAHDVISNKKRECTLISDNEGVSHG